MDGFCRHVVALVFEIIDCLDDSTTKSVTSGPCMWKRKRLLANSDGVLATDLGISLCKNQTRDIPALEVYNPIADNETLPSVDDYVKMVQNIRPNACMLDAFQKRSKERINYSVATNLVTPIDKLFTFCFDHNHMCTPSCALDFINCLRYSDTEINDIDSSTEGQSENPNWHNMRKGILTSSSFKDVCASRDFNNTADRLLHGNALNNDNCVPFHIAFGKRYEEKARNMFKAAHRFHHRKGIKCNVPGLIVSQSHPFLATSPDGVMDCKTCGKALIEVKCLSSKRNFYPKTALVILDICDKSENGDLSLKQSHRYYFQVQGQMAITGIHRCYFVAYTHKGIHQIEVKFDPDMWQATLNQLSHFYQSVYFHKFKDSVTNELIC